MTTPYPRFHVENFGPIREGEVELRPLTVLIGKNNTGKTYMAQAINAAHKALAKALETDLEAPHGETEFATLATYLQSNDFLRIRDRMDAPPSDPLFDLPPHEVPSDQSVPDEVLDVAYSWIRQCLRQASEELSGRLRAYFNVPDLRDISSWGQDREVSFQIFGRANSDDRYEFGTSETSLAVPRGTSELDQAIFLHIASAMRYINRVHAYDRTPDPDLLVHYIYAMGIPQRLCRDYLSSREFLTTTHYLPAGRSGLLQAWTDYVGMKLQVDRDRFGLAQPPQVSLSGVSLDFIAEFQSMFAQHRSVDTMRRQIQEHRAKAGDRFGSALELLRQTIEGSIGIYDDASEVPALNYQQDGEEIPIHRASSMVADLAPLAIWTEELVRPGDVLIIDEPESHLHPEAIRLVARALVRLSNSGVRVLCTTHSSVLLHQISNCILSCSAHIENEELTEEDKIPASRISVYRFLRREGTRRVHVEEAKIDPEWGIPEEEYVEVAESLTNQTAHLISASQS